MARSPDGQKTCSKNRKKKIFSDFLFLISVHKRCNNISNNDYELLIILKMVAILIWGTQIVEVAEDGPVLHGRVVQKDQIINSNNNNLRYPKPKPNLRKIMSTAFNYLSNTLLKITLES